MRTLVVENDPSARRQLSQLLSSRGHHVTQAIDAEAAVEAHRQVGFLLMLVDWTLPGMDGLALCRRIRALPGGDEPFIILATDPDKTENVLAALDAGVSDCLTRPFDPVIVNTRLTIAERAVLERARRRLAEEALHSSEASFRAMVEGSPDTIVVHSHGRILYVNPSGLSTLGYSHPEELIGRAYLELTHQDDRGKILRQIRTVCESGEARPAQEERFVREDGSVCTLETVTIPLEFDGEAAVAILARDLTERKQMERHLVRADRMASVGTMAAGIAHEINNPLSYVMTNLQLLQEELTGLNQGLSVSRLDELLELLAQAQDGAERVRLIVRDLRSFSRVDSDDETRGPTDVHKALDSAVSMAWNEIRHRAQLEKKYGSVPPVRGTEAKLGQVFLNLLVNAAQALPVGRANENRIEVSTFLDPSGRVVVEVTDTGVGMSEEVLHRVFDPFFTTKPVGVGIGLGLSICHNIVTSLGGEMAAYSKLGQGTTMRVTLKPVASANAGARAPLPRAAGAEAGILKILIVDDEPGIAQSLRRVLQRHDVTICLSGREAIKQINANPPYDLIFCDLMMPDVSGMELYREAGKRVPSLRDRMVFMTGGAFTKHAIGFLERIANPWLEKPFDIRQVQELVHQCCRSMRPGAPPNG